ncbi:MAG: adenylate/guanylate cyclase domain-containing protein [Chloroflexota bacterium]
MNTATPGPHPEERRLVTVLFADLQGFTTLADHLDYETVGDMIREVWFELDQVIEAHRGYIDKHMGDAFMVIWGAPHAREDDAERAVSASLAIQDALKKYKSKTPRAEAQQLMLRVGVNTGPVLAGYVGLRGEYTVMGDTVNVAKRLEESAEAGTVVISESTYRFVRGAFRMRRLNPIELRGKTEPIQAYLVEDILSQPSMLRYRSSGGLVTRLVGRETELLELKKHYKQMLDTTQPRLVLVSGEAGLGKSRLLMEFTSQLEVDEPHLTLISGRALEQMSKVPFYLWKSLWHSRFGISDDDQADVARKKFLRGILDLWGKKLGPTPALEAAHFIGDLAGLTWPDSPYLAGLTEKTQTRINKAFSLTSELLQRMSSSGPLVLLFDDLQWADEGSMKLLTYLTTTPTTEPLPLLLLTGARPDIHRYYPNLVNNAHVIQLIPLTLSPKTMSEAYPGLPTMSQSVSLELIQRAEGNPYFLEEMVKSMMLSGLLDADLSSLDMVEHLRYQLPQSLTSLLQARLDALSSDARGVALLASVVGRVFWQGAVIAAAKQAVGTTSILKPTKQGLVSQIEKGLVELTVSEMAFPGAASTFSGEKQFIFKHTLLRDVAYSLLPHKYRRQSHLAIAKWLMPRAGIDYSAIIADHLERAGEIENAITYYQKALANAMVRGTVKEAAWLRSHIQELHRLTQ